MLAFVSFYDRKLCTKLVSVKQLLVEFKQVTEGYPLDQIFNSGEVGLCYNRMPQRNLSSPYDVSAEVKKLESEQPSVPVILSNFHCWWFAGKRNLVVLLESRS